MAPDAAGVGRAREFARALKVDLAIVDHRGTTDLPYSRIVGDVKGRRVIILDDMVDTGRTLVRACEGATAAGAAIVDAYCVHGIFSGIAVERLEASPLRSVTVADTVPLSEKARRSGKIRTVSIAPMLAKVIKCIHHEESVSALFAQRMTPSNLLRRRIAMDVDLSVQVRTKTGKGPARRLRRKETVPAILYGPKTAPVPLAVPAMPLLKLLRDMGEESKLIRLRHRRRARISRFRQALIREVQTHPVRRRFLHVDFYEVPLDQPILVEVPVELDGESIGEKKGGVLNLIRRTLSVRCLPGEIPERVHIDISGMDLGSSVHVADLIGRVPFELMDDKSTAVVAMVVPEEMTKAAETPEEEQA